MPGVTLGCPWDYERRGHTVEKKNQSGVTAPHSKAPQETTMLDST